MNGVLQKILRFAFFLSIGLTILWLLYNNQAAAYAEQCKLDGIPADQCNFLDKVFADISSADIKWLLVILGLYVLSNMSRALRWRQLLSALGYNVRFGNAFWSTILGYFANLGLPRMGEFIRAGSLARYENIPFDQSTGTVIVDRLLDMLTFILMFSLAMILEGDVIINYLKEHAVFPGSSLWSNPIFYLIIIAWIIIGIALFMNRNRFEDFTIYRRIKDFIAGIIAGIRSVTKVKNLPLLIFHSLFIWGMYYLMTYLCFFAFVPTEYLGPQEGLLVFIFASLGMMVPSPGGMGSYHLMIMAGLSLYGVSTNDGFSFANIIFFTIQIFGNVLPGILALIILPLINRDKS